MANYSLAVDGSGQNFTLPFPAISGDWALSLWLRLTNASGSFIAAIDNSGARVFTLFLTAAGANAGFDGTMMPQTGTVGATTWHHLVVTRTGTTLTAYSDGASISSAFNGGSSSAIDVHFGDNASGGGSHFQGKYADIRLYTGGGLSSGNVTTLYGGGDVVANLARHWGLTEGSGNPGDSVGGNTGTLNTATWDTDVPAPLSGGGGGGFIDNTSAILRCLLAGGVPF